MLFSYLDSKQLIKTQTVESEYTKCRSLSIYRTCFWILAALTFIQTLNFYYDRAINCSENAKLKN